MASPPNVFVVDDEPEVRKAIKLMLENSDCQVWLFASAQAFLDQFDDSDHGCVISDVRMPGIDGMQLLTRLQERNASMPVLMLSAHGDIAMAVRAMQLGAVDFLEKPIDPYLLRQKVSEAIRKDEHRLVDLEERNEIAAALETLTPREREVLDLLIDGKSAKMIGTILGTAHNTVRVQRANVIRKMKADNVVDLLRMVKFLR